MCYPVHQKSLALKHELKKQFHCTPIQQAMQYAEKELLDAQERVHSEPHNSEILDKELMCTQVLKQVKKKYGSLMQQKAKVDWLTYGDDNTIFYHNSIKHRAAHNKINTFVLDGNTVSNPSLIKHSFISFYCELLCHKLRDRKRVNMNIIGIGPLLSNSMRENLPCPSLLKISGSSCEVLMTTKPLA